MAVKKWVGAAGVKGKAGKWTETAAWSPTGLPAVTSELEISAFAEASGLEINTTIGKAKQLDFTGYTGALTSTATAFVAIGTTTGSGTALKLAEGMTATFNAATVLSFVGTSASVEKITCAGKTLPTLQFVGTGGKWQLADTCRANEIYVEEGTFDTNNQEVKAALFKVKSAATKIVKLGSSTIILSTATGNAWEVESATGTTIEAGTSTIQVTGASANFEGLGFTYATVELFGNNPVTGSNTFATLAINNKGNEALGKGVLLKNGTKQTLTTSLTTNGTAVAKARLESDKAGTRAKLSKASGQVVVENLIIKDNEAEGGAEWYAAKGCVDGGNNVGWKFEEPPGTVGKLAGTGKVVFAGTTAIAGRAAVAGSTSVRFAGTDSIAARAAVASSTGVRFGSSASLGARAALATSTSVVFGSTARIAARAALAGSTVVRFGGKGTLSAVSALKRLASRFLFWFDEEEP